jgi:hypothetical protein
MAGRSRSINATTVRIQPEPVTKVSDGVEGLRRFVAEIEGSDEGESMFRAGPAL